MAQSEEFSRTKCSFLFVTSFLDFSPTFHICILKIMLTYLLPFLSQRVTTQVTGGLLNTAVSSAVFNFTYIQDTNQGSHQSIQHFKAVSSGQTPPCRGKSLKVCLQMISQSLLALSAQPQAVTLPILAVPAIVESCELRSCEMCQIQPVSNDGYSLCYEDYVLGNYLHLFKPRVSTIFKTISKRKSFFLLFNSSL